MENQFKAEIVLTQDSENNYKYSGELHITTYQPLEIESIAVEVVMTVTGRMSPIYENLINIDLLKHSKSLALGTQKFSFEFTLPDDTISGYEGKNAIINYECVAEVYLDDENYRKLDVSLFKNFLTYVTKTNAIKVKKSFEFKKEIDEYKVTAKDYKLTFFNPTALIIVIISFLIAYGYLIYIGTISFSKIFLYFFVAFFAGALYVAIVYYAFLHFFNKTNGTAIVKISPYKKGQFQCKVSGLHAIKNPKIYYEIIEKVVDRRGTSSSTYTSTIYTSKSQDLSTLNPTVTFDFPIDKNLANLNVRDTLKLLWKIKIKGDRNSASGEFEVKN